MPYSIISYVVLLLSAQLLTVHGTFNTRTVATFPNAWLENLVVRSGRDNLLVTSFFKPEVLLVDTNPISPTAPVVLTSFPDATSCTGIVELGKDVFYVIAGNFTSQPVVSVPGSFSLWEINLANYHGGMDVHGITKRRVASLPQSGALNGLTILSVERGIVLAADGLKGCIWSINVSTGAVQQIMSDQTMMSGGDTTETGVADIKVRVVDKHTVLYWSNTSTESLHRTMIDPKSGVTLQEQSLLYVETNDTFAPGNFAIDKDGNVWVVNHGLDQLVKLVQDSEKWFKEIIVDEKGLQPTALAFGESDEEIKQGTIFVSTARGEIVKVDVGKELL